MFFRKGCGIISLYSKLLLTRHSQNRRHGQCLRFFFCVFLYIGLQGCILPAPILYHISYAYRVAFPTVLNCNFHLFTKCSLSFHAWTNVLFSGDKPVYISFGDEVCPLLSVYAVDGVTFRYTLAMVYNAPFYRPIAIGKDGMKRPIPVRTEVLLKLDNVFTIEFSSAAMQNARWMGRSVLRHPVGKGAAF